MKFIYFNLILFSTLTFTITLTSSRLKTPDQNKVFIEKCKQRCKMGSNDLHTLTDFGYHTDIDTIIPYTNTFVEVEQKNYYPSYNFICQCLDYKFMNKKVNRGEKDQWDYNLYLGNLEDSIKKGQVVAVDIKSDTVSSSYLKPLLEKLIPQQKERCNKICSDETDQTFFGGIFIYERDEKWVLGDKAGCKCIIKPKEYELSYLRQTYPGRMGAILNLKGDNYKQDLIENYQKRVGETLKSCKKECTFSPKLFESIKGQTENLVCDCLVDTFVVNINTLKFTKTDNKMIKDAIKNEKFFKLVQ